MGVLIPDSIRGLIRGLIRGFMEGIVDEVDTVDGDGEEGMKLDSFMQRVRLRKVRLCQEHPLHQKQ